MKVRQITYAFSETINTGRFENKKPMMSMTADMLDDDDPIVEMERVKEVVRELMQKHKEEIVKEKTQGEIEYD